MTDLIRQLANLGMRKLISEDSYHQDLNLLLKRSKNVPKKSSFLKRDLDARKDSEAYRVMFCLPAGEKLDGRVECFLFTPFNKKYRYLFQNSCSQCGRLLRSSTGLAPSTSAATSPASPPTCRASFPSSCPSRTSTVSRSPPPTPPLEAGTRRLSSP